MKPTPTPRKAASSPPRRGGRPSKNQAALIDARILNAARDLFFAQGYGATSIEELAATARMSKRTFYARYKDKADVFRAVVHHVIGGMRPADTASLFTGGSTEAILRRVAEIILRASLTPHLLALHRLLMAESARFPELVEAMSREGARQEAITRIAALLKHEAKGGSAGDAAFAAEQFIHMAMAAPQRRALGLGAPLSEAEIKRWARRSVALFLHGWQGAAR